MNPRMRRAAFSGATMVISSTIRLAVGCAAPVAIASATIAGSAGLQAQTIEGRLVDSATGRSMPNAYVVLIDSVGEELVRAPTDDDGRFRLFPPRAGTYRVDLAQVGWAADPSAPFAVAPGNSTSIEYAVSPRQVDLSSVNTLTSCGSVENVRSVWEEARDALGATSWTAAARRHTIRMRLFRRELHPDARSVVTEDDSTTTGAPGLPFANDQPENIVDSGFARSDSEGRLTYYVPDPATLLHPLFEQSHCFAMEIDNGRLALRFAPRSDAHTGVTGTLWLDSATTELQRLDFGYTNDPSGAADDRVGGTVAYRRISPIDWVVTTWRLRMPEMVESDSGGPGTLVGFQEVGGNLLEVTDSTETPLYADRSTSVLTGKIFDGTRGAPLANAVVTLVGTDHWTTTDPSGQFVIAGHLEGIYRLAFGHPGVDSLGFKAPARVVQLDRQTPVNIELAVPPFDSIVAQRCEGATLPDQGRVLHGRVRDASGRPVFGALVQVSRSIMPAALQQLMSEDLNLLAVTDSTGEYALCGIPVGRSIVVNAAIEGESSDMVAVEFNQDGVRLNERTLALHRPVARLDLRLAPHAERDTEISGAVTNAASGEAVSGALVQLDGTGFTAQTNATGRFRMRGVPMGMINLSVRRVGFRSVHRQVMVRQAQPVSLAADSLAMMPVDDTVTELDPITVSAEPYARKLAGFEDRRQMGIGSFITREEFEKWNPSVATDVLRHMHGVTVVPNGAMGAGGDLRRYVIRSSRDVGQRITRVLPMNTVRSAGSFNEGGNTVVTECAMLVFLDGMYLGDTRDTDVDNIISTPSLTAVEVYTASQVPARFRLQGSTCGVVVFWTR